MKTELVHDALRALIETVNATGGVHVIGTSDGSKVCTPVADDNWPDLADAYLRACEAMGVEPVAHDDMMEGMMDFADAHHTEKADKLIALAKGLL